MNATPAAIKVTISQARARFSKWVNQASEGKVITITRHGQAVALLVAAEKNSKSRIGTMKGNIAVPDDFDASLPDDLLNAFEA
ncbi:type II toxin-antitoxin system prevent-host-death family antitoxin [Pseudomonas poae]|uniref:type II toxin-antitoxin system Phd/YefM family antitoxin n=1 Tax=Pseudomonas cremoris TaxID=2724178 RepID=UPI000F7CFB0C|nr:type II toxin-antitoxin system prevent-host-death family antitoxin [Pseudomonas cremoris]AZP72415.1 type II toxin-antitoxin system prevent-host-death family antitoxin [Pseudomonas poae]